MDDSLDTQIVIIYSLVDDILKSIQYNENPQCLMSVAEVCTTAIARVGCADDRKRINRGTRCASFLSASYARYIPKWHWERAQNCLNQNFQNALCPPFCEFFNFVS
jgi:hypothetical protein